MLPCQTHSWSIPSTHPARIIPIGSMYGIFNYTWLIFIVHVGIYTIHGSYGNAGKTIACPGWVRDVSKDRDL